eukprot:jgi/Hompol1/6423/HPOL_003483-RA
MSQLQPHSLDSDTAATSPTPAYTGSSSTSVSHREAQSLGPPQATFREFLSLGRRKKSSLTGLAGGALTPPPPPVTLYGSPPRETTAIAAAGPARVPGAAASFQEIPEYAEPPGAGDSSLEHELRDIFEGERWAVVFSDLPRLAARVRFRDATGELRRPASSAQLRELLQRSSTGTSLAASAAMASGPPVEGAVPENGQNGDTREAAQHQQYILGDMGNTLSQEPSASTETGEQAETDMAQDPNTDKDANATQLLFEVASHLEAPAVLESMSAALQEDPSLASGDSHAVKFLIESVLTPTSRTALLMRSINQAVVITAAWYLHQNLLAPAGVQVKDVRSADGWRVILDFKNDNRALFVTHIRREQSLASSTDAFELEWSLHLSFDGSVIFQGCMLKLESFAIAEDHSLMTPSRIDSLMRHFCNGNQLVLSQEVASTNSPARPQMPPFKDPFAPTFDLLGYNQFICGTNDCNANSRAFFHGRSNNWDRFSL